MVALVGLYTLLVDHAIQPSRPILGLPYLLTVA